MTSRERLMAAARGESVDRKPVIVCDGSAEADAVVLRGEVNAEPGQLVLMEVLNPYGRASAFGLELNELLGQDPEAGAAELDKLCEDVRTEIEEAMNAGADGICYRLVGAEPNHTTPMQYGGFYLERDRELLDDASHAKFNLLWIDAGVEAYLDFVSDLRADAFAWDIDRTDVSVVQMREMRKGALAAEDPTADILFATSFGALEPWIEREGVEANA